MPAENSNHLRICMDRVVPDVYQPERVRAERAFRDHPPSFPGFDRLPPIDARAPVVFKMAIAVFKKWPTGETLHCRFLDGSSTQRKKVEAKAHVWEEYANVKFKFISTGDAEIRISFYADPGSWSALGTDALIENYFPKFQPTMNFGWLRDDTEDQEYERVVVHEFGHALGCIHEHQNPAEKLKWNKAEVYQAFSGPPNYWTKEEIDDNILRRYSRTQTQFSKFDAGSIMLYHFPGSLFVDGKGTPNNTHLSQQDKSFIAQMYPKPNRMGARLVEAAALER